MAETDHTVVSKVLSLICELNKIKQTWNSLHYVSLLESLVKQPPGHIGCQMYKATSTRTQVGRCLCSQLYLQHAVCVFVRETHTLVPSHNRREHIVGKVAVA